MRNVYTDEEFKTIMQVCKEKQITVLIDEAYHYFYPKTFIQYALNERHVFVTSVLAYWYLVKYFWLLLPFYGTIKETAVISYGKTKKVQNQTYG